MLDSVQYIDQNHNKVFLNICFKDYFHITLLSRPQCHQLWCFGRFMTPNSKALILPQGSTYEPKSRELNCRRMKHIIMINMRRPSWGSAPTLTSPCCARKPAFGHLLFQCQTVGERGEQTIELIVQSSGPLGRSQTATEVFLYILTTAAEHVVGHGGEIHPGLLHFWISYTKYMFAFVIIKIGLIYRCSNSLYEE